MNMSVFNGLQACVTCEQPGKVVTSKERDMLESSDRLQNSILCEHSKTAMASATDRKRVKGFRGIFLVW